MADMTKITTPIVSTSVQGSSKSSAPKGYAQAGDVTRRAGVMNEEDSPQNKASLKRLGHALNSDQPLRGDVPTGYYLNITV